VYTRHSTKLSPLKTDNASEEQKAP